MHRFAPLSGLSISTSHEASLSRGLDHCDGEKMVHMSMLKMIDSDANSRTKRHLSTMLAAGLVRQQREMHSASF